MLDKQAAYNVYYQYYHEAMTDLENSQLIECVKAVNYKDTIYESAMGSQITYEQLPLKKLD